MSRSLNLSQADLVFRLRRWAGIAGGNTPTTTDAAQLVAVLGSLDKDPYQNEFGSFSVSMTPSIAVGNISFVALQNGSIGSTRNAPVICLDRIDVFSATGQAYVINAFRPSSNAGANLAVGAYQRGWPTGTGTIALAQFVNNNAAGGSGGVILASLPTLAANQLFTWQPPQPYVLFPPQNSTVNGDAVYINAGTTDTAFTATYYWREYNPFKY